jgi:hypothetical protein
MDDGSAFERFVNSTILVSHQPDAFSADADLLESICVGGQADTGIDGIAVKINGVLVRSVSDAADIIKSSKRASVEFVFIQSKYKPHFDSHELSIFISGVRNFLSNPPTLPVNDRIQDLLTLKDFVLSDDVVYNWDSNPSVRMYYVAMGKWRNEPLHVALAEKAKADILGLNTYDDVELQFVDSEYLKQILDSNDNKFTTIIETIDSMELTPVSGVDNSCVVLCNAEEFSRMLVNEQGLIRKNLFEDNVRDYQGLNAVNSEISDTIAANPAKFVLLNNGITIVCDDFSPNNRKLKIVNPQIVNGCQTSNVIFDALRRGRQLNNIALLIRVISTKNSDITNEIVRGTNRQNIVLDETFEAIREFHKNLEEFFNSFNGELPEKIYYERRSKQYADTPSIKQTHKINLRILTQYFTAMFLNRPHKSFRHESILLREFGDLLFQEGQSMLPYYVTSYAFVTLERLFREKGFHRDLRSFKSHLLMMFRQQVAGPCPTISSEKAMDEHAKSIIKVLKIPGAAEKEFDQVAKMLRAAMHSWTTDLKRSRFAMKDVEEFTEFIMARLSGAKSTAPSSDLREGIVHRGVIMKTIIDRNGRPCGFIKRPPDNVFFHSKESPNLDFHSLEGRFVEYKLTKRTGDDRLQAYDVRLLEKPTA